MLYCPSLQKKKICLNLGGMVVRWPELLPHIKKVAGLIPSRALLCQTTSHGPKTTLNCLYMWVFVCRCFSPAINWQLQSRTIPPKSMSI